MLHVALIRQTSSANVCNNCTLVYDRDEEGVLRVIERIDAGFAGCNASQECGMFKFDNFDSALNYTGKVRSRGGVEDTRLEAKAKAKDTKKIRGQGQGQPFRGQTLSRPRTGMLEAKAKDQGHKRKCSPKKEKKKKVFTKIL